MADVLSRAVRRRDPSALGPDSPARHPHERRRTTDADLAAGRGSRIRRSGFRDLGYDTETTFGWSYPIGSWLNEIVGGWKYHAVTDKVGARVPLEFAKIWRVTQARTENPVKFGTMPRTSPRRSDGETDAYAQDKMDRCGTSPRS
jgi:hypothetical protein